MKKFCPPGGLLVLLAILGRCPAVCAQFTGKLTYQLDRNNTRLVMTYYQSGTNVKVTAYDIKLKNGVPDSSTIFPQDTILFDLAGAIQTSLHYQVGKAIKTRYMANIQAAIAAKSMKGKGSVSAQKMPDSALVNGYQASHYQVIEQSAMGTGTRDVWVTQAMGGTPSIWTMGPYLYYTPGYPYFTALTNAGASGVVVQVKSSFSRGGAQYTMNLVSVDWRRIPAGVFSVPSNYTVIDNSNMIIP